MILLVDSISAQTIADDLYYSYYSVRFRDAFSVQLKMTGRTMSLSEF